MANYPDRQTLIAYAKQVAAEYGIDPNIFVAQINQESGFRPDASNPSGASGIAQLMPQYYPGVDTLDPYASLRAAAATDAGYLKRYGGDYNMMLAAYNAGPGNVDKYGGIPPFQETQTYVKNIMGSAGAAGRVMAGNTDNGSLVDQAMGSSSPAQADSASPYTAQGASSPIGVLAPEDLAGIAQQHGGVIGAVPLDPQVTDPLTLGKKNNPTPKIRYTFADGTHFTVRFNASAGGADGGWDVVDGGTVFSTSKSGSTQPKQLTANPNSPYIVIQNPDGTQGYIPNPNYNPSQIINTSSNDPYIITRDANGKLTTQPNPNYQPIASRSQGQVQRFPDGSLWQQDPASGAWTQVAAADPLQRQQLQLQIAQAQKQLLPDQQRLLEDAGNTAQYLHQLYVDGKISLQDMNNTMQQVWANVDAGLKGTTVFQQEQEAAQERAANAQIGRDILQQRLQTGSNLAQGILNTAANSHIMLPKGQATLGLNPLQMAMEAVNAFGGADTGSLAQNLIRGLTQNGQNPSPRMPDLKALLAMASQAGGAAPAPASMPTNNNIGPDAYPFPAYGGTQGPYQPDFSVQPPSAKDDWMVPGNGTGSYTPSGGVYGPDTPYQPTSMDQLGSGALSPDTTPNQNLSVNVGGSNPGVSLSSPSQGASPLAAMLLSALIGGAARPALQQGLSALGVR